MGQFASTAAQANMPIRNRTMNESEYLGISRRQWMQSALIAASLPLSAWGQPPAPADDDDDDDDNKKYQTRIETSLIGDHTTYAGMEPVVLEGVGLVRGLSGTGGDPAPSQYRSALLEELKKQGFRNPNAILQSPDTALVLVRAYLMPLMKKGERIDVRIVTPASANATSLVGGELMSVRLSDRAIIDGKYMDGKVYAVARGPVLTDGLGASTVSEPVLLRQGRVLSGGVVTKERDLVLILKNDFRMRRNSERIADAIGRRFHDFDEHGIKKPLATAKTDQKLILTLHPRYKGNAPRYLQVIRHMAFRETPVEMRVRMNRLKHDLVIPETSLSSSLQLEAIGNEAIPALKQGLLAPTIECRFHSACALAYLGDSSGLSALVEASKKERAFRVFSLTAMSALEDAEAHLALRELMNESIEETRYGAFRALWTLDRNDPFIRGEALGMREDAENHDNEYKLHVLKTTGPEVTHVTLRTRPEIVVFGAEQEFRAPMYASAGKHIMVTAQPGATTITLARFEVGKSDQKKEVSMRVADVIRAANELGANYPDILQLLADASRQKNLPNELATDKLPQAGRVYYRPASNGEQGRAKPVKIGRDNFAPTAFPEYDDPEEAARRKEQSARDPREETESGGSMASVPSESQSSATGSDANSTSDKKKDRSSNKTDKSKSSWTWFGGSK
jgi:flagellar basal body P-ring protein FlgI